MKLYHGSTVIVKHPSVQKGRKATDFGKGFYLTDIEEQARQMAIRRTRIAGEGSPTVTVYTFDERLLNDSSLQVKIFDKPSKEWALFVLANRKGIAGQHYDIVIGPIADDGVAFQLERYMRRMITLETLVEGLTYRKLNRQYFFGTELSISKLQRL